MTSPLRETLTSRRFWSYSLVAALCRAPALMVAVATTTTSLMLTGRIDTGALMTTCHVVGTLAATPIAARIVGGRPARRVLGVQMAAHGLLWLALWAAIGTGQPVWTWYLGAALAGTVIAGSGGVIRSLLPYTVPENAGRSASTVDVTFMDLLIFLAPLVVAATAPLHPLGPIAAMALVSLIAVAVLPFTGLPSPETDTDRRGSRLRWNTAAVAWIVFGAAIGVYFATVEVGATALITSYGLDVGLAWIVFLLLSIASVVGGYLDAARTPGRHEALWAFGAVALLVAGCLLLASGPPLPLAALALLLSGLPVAALLGLRSHMIDVAVPPAQRAGYFSWAFATQNVGFAIGSTALAVIGQPALLTAASLATMVALVVAVGVSRSVREQAPEAAVRS
ncbi:MFS transporter [Nocardiopsis lambiniae]|uniref:MFS transporter n=1 Tax=Nocardiopsis lambiniae TaxID=3075539 RepID=A0ABU2ME65_9ACTN|nr:MFS transporter [Nocardiopsis sp. DSM 44743]MDT0330835.1 hypothetical protein [Nocardiopsis sp. DSM 44743]